MINNALVIVTLVFWWVCCVGCSPRRDETGTNAPAARRLPEAKEQALSFNETNRAHFAQPEKNASELSERLAGVTNARIKFNEKVGEFQMVIVSTNGNSIYPMYYDPFTGLELKSRRDELFYEIDPLEFEKAKTMFSEYGSINEITNAIGQPDRVWEKGIEGRQIDYERQFKTVVVRVREDRNKQISIIYSRKSRE